MDLTEFTNSLKEKIANKEKLEQEKKQIEQALADKLRVNYKTIFEPELAKLVEMDELLRKATGKSFITELDGGNLCYYPRCYSLVGLRYKKVLVTLNDYSSNNLDYIRDFSALFASVDSTIAFLDRVKSEIFMARFKIYEGFLDKQTEYLRDTIATLLERMSESSSVKENANGTIEITINGKTYVGAVKEVGDENGY